MIYSFLLRQQNLLLSFIKWTHFKKQIKLLLQRKCFPLLMNFKNFEPNKSTSWCLKRCLVPNCESWGHFVPFFPLTYCRNIKISTSHMSLAAPCGADLGTQKWLHYAGLCYTVLYEITIEMQMPAGFSYSWKYTWTESLPGSVIRSYLIFLPSLRSAGGYPQKGGLGSWHCVRGPGRCRAAEGRNEPTGSADQL